MDEDLLSLAYTSLRYRNEDISSVFDGSCGSLKFDEFSLGLGQNDARKFGDSLAYSLGDPVPAVDGDEAIAVGHKDDWDVQVDVIGSGQVPVDRDSNVNGELSVNGWLPNQIGYAGDGHGSNLTRPLRPNQLFGLSYVPLVSCKLKCLRGVSPLD